MQTDFTDSFSSIIAHWASSSPDGLAVLAPGRQPLSYAALLAQIEYVTEHLHNLNIQSHDRVMILAPQGVDAAIATLATGASAIAIPVSSNSNPEQIRHCIQRVGPAATLVHAQVDATIRNFLHETDSSILELTFEPDTIAGRFSILDAACLTGRAVASTPQQLGLLLPTSGTTAQGKFVCLTQQNVGAAARNTAQALAIVPGEVCLDMASIFHAHGLVAGMLASIFAGATVICPDRLDTVAFFDLLKEYSPTWFTAVPTMHQAILNEAANYRDLIKQSRIRVIRSASAYLPDAVRRGLEEQFHTIVTESYGLTEAMQLTNTPLDSDSRKIGSLGIAGSSELGILDCEGRLAGTGRVGEIIARGPVVTSGYWQDPDANQEVFIDGWFRTGDLGYLDQDGHLFMTGRIKDQINRGGEKIAPQEIDAALLRHPSIKDAIAFGIPHPALGEEVAAAIVLRPDMPLDQEDIRKYALENLPESKAPKRIFLVNEIAASSTGKLLRRNLAAWAIKQIPTTQYAEPRTNLERHLVKVWQEVLGHSPIGIDDDFFDLGGHSLLAVRMFTRLREECETPTTGSSEALQASTLMIASTIRHLAARLESPSKLPAVPAERAVVRLGHQQMRNAFFLFTGVYAGEAFYPRLFARHLGPRQPILALAPHDITLPGAPKTIEAMADDFLVTVRKEQAHGPYMIGGYSHAGLVAWEVARLLEDAGEQVALLFIIDTVMPEMWLIYVRQTIRRVGQLRRWSSEQEADEFIRWRYRIQRLRELWQSERFGLVGHYWKKLIKRTRRIQREGNNSETENPGELVARLYRRAGMQYVPQPGPKCRVTLVYARDGAAVTLRDTSLGWRNLCADLEVFEVPGGHASCLLEHVDLVAERLRQELERVQGSVANNTYRRSLAERGRTK